MGWEAELFRDDVERALHDEANDVAMLACEVVAAIDRPNAAALKSLVGLLDNTFCARPATAALRHLLRQPREGLTEAAAPVLDAMFEASGRRQSLLARLTVEAGLRIPFDRCAAEYREDPGNRWLFIGEMIRYGDYPADVAVPFVVGELEAGAQTYSDGHLAVLCRALVRFGPDAAPAVRVLISLLKHGDNDTRASAVTLLGAIGSKAKAALSELDRLATSAAEAAAQIRRRVEAEKAARAARPARPSGPDGTGASR
jgi:hypothetical protein